ncbi:hypothetical protein phiK7B1_114 [Pseudomonas phage phiK7B1]|nr:hypothetical protein phiK7B1_114 [Pseudomonas phage phiK7B1]
MAKSVAHKIDERALLPEPTTCPYCKSAVKYTSHAEIYGGRTFSDWPFIYLCTNKSCNASVGVHAGTNHPLGTLADEKTKTARKAAHAAFDPIWKNQKNKGKARTEAYKWLAEQLDIERWRCHISWFDVSYCEKVVKACLSRNQN